MYINHYSKQTKVRILFFLGALLPTNFILAKKSKDKSFVVVIPSYNNSKFYIKNLNSVMRQKYQNYRIIYIDDASSDGTAELVEQYIAKNGLQSKFTLLKNTQRKRALANLYEAISGCSDHEIIVNLDGDDWFANTNVLSYLNKIYKKRNIWLTYGQYKRYPSGQIGLCEKIPKQVIETNSFREYKWCSSHLRTFYAGLFKKISTKHLKYKNNFFPLAYDHAMMFPMLEMAGRHSYFIPHVLYIYNCSNPLMTWVKESNEQQLMGHYIRSMKKYKNLKKLF